MKLHPIHPGEVLREEFLVPMGITAGALAKNLHTDAPRVNDIVRGRRNITADTAMRLARYFGNSATFWLNLQTQYDLDRAHDALDEKIKREVRPREAAHA
ncbi:MAG TPA: HigA family addiction module antitoxin [Verrucomicrobiae bacterium]|jgi:addiction module HigA family antidote|nr:HigA family addiction module antitoxin [Verrucomicrobiae bacterium]